MNDVIKPLWSQSVVVALHNMDLLCNFVRTMKRESVFFWNDKRVLATSDK